MYQLGHYGAALLAYAPVGFVVAGSGRGELAAVGGIVAVALSTVPDCDHRLPVVDHRGPTHTLAFALLVGGILAALTLALREVTGTAYAPELVGFAFGVGCLSICSHLLADAITPMGIRPFWPLSKRHYTLDLTPAANPVANYALFVLGVVAVALAGASLSGFF